MDTLIELYDDRAIENVISPEIFRPSRVVYLCPAQIARNDKFKNNIINFYRKRGFDIEVEFLETSPYKADKIQEHLEAVYKRYPNMVIDITGGSDAMLFAAGMFCNNTGVGAFTYSRKTNRFYNIINAEFVDQVQCDLKYSVSDFFAMTGGHMRKGRVDNKTLMEYEKYFIPFFNVYLKYKHGWTDAIVFFQRISQPKDDYINLKVRGAVEQKADHGRRVCANENLLRDLVKIGFLKELHFSKDGTEVGFVFKDMEIRSWLRDVGSVLELFMYKACVDSEIFNDIISSAVVDWEGYVGHDSVSNEIDVVASRGIVPIFISCKACEVKTEALNELAVLRDRFGGKGAKAAIVTTEACNAATRHRAAQLHIAVIDIEELLNHNVSERIKVIMKVKK